MKKYVKIVLIGVLCLVFAVLINGCYYVFWGQEKSMKKLQNNQDLNFYECCSIYSIHTAIWMFGWTISPEAAQQAFLMLKPHKYPVSIHNDYFITPKDELRYKLAFPDNLEIKKDKWRNSMYDLSGQIIYSNSTLYSCSFYVTYSNIVYKVGNIKLYGSLLKYIQDKDWIHGFDIEYYN